MLKKLLFPLASSLLPASLAHALPGPAGGPQSLAVGYYEFPPYIYTDDDGSTQGEGAELIRKLLRQAGYRAELRALPSARLYQGLRDGSVQLWAGAPGKPELAESTLECEHVLGQVTLNLYRLASQPAPHLPQGLAGSRVILISGYSYWRPATQLLDDPRLNLEVHRTTTHNAALQMLLRDRGDYLLDYQAPVEEARNAAGLPPLAYDTLYRLPLKLIVSRRTPDAEQLRQRLDQAFEQLSAKGEKVELN
ncbi:polar amino acid transport system substrate-binding protein [Pseudomonas delhiensis]|uniref:Polar amino acid transport system substrate-binding protein n=1 Tax=Pseudomonas delhiensis TaxID=366289 RepID=A0A239EH01_9PSED|nr:transporter substrate-binding domain-containing protein [Pseudomonas delhiensis]SDL10387.1 polar amino acid transport system substrate-binding protein [Pseudomonas delhiensis]SNS43293.1 polar amino acid transport system substrate-binding protein [Pseudomonas delhiensis]